MLSIDVVSLVSDAMQVTTREVVTDPTCEQVNRHHGRTAIELAKNAQMELMDLHSNIDFFWLIDRVYRHRHDVLGGGAQEGFKTHD